MLLNRIDAVYFKDHLYELLNLIEKHLHHTAGSVHFHKILKAMLFYAPSDRVFQYKLDYVSTEVGAPVLYKMLMLLLILSIPAIFFLMIFGLVDHSGRMPKIKRVNPLDKLEPDAYSSVEYLLEEQKLNMLNFIEARMFTVQNSEALKSQVPLHPIKYGNPFELDLFRIDLESIKNTGKHINIFNDTERECVVLAYFNTPPNAYLKGNVLGICRTYALYLPKKDSIQIDLKMSDLRFYMGKNLRNFNNYRGYVYPDSNDFKFSEFSKKDSILFRYVFVLNRPDSLYCKQQNLIISQPGPEQYKLAWTGKSPINYYITNLNYLADTLTRTNVLLLPDGAKPAL